MAAGKRPFEGKSQLSLASSILEKDPDPISTFKPQTPPAFEHVITTCLQKNPDDRYLAAHDIKIELQWISLEKLTPPASSIAAVVKQPRLPWIAALVAVLILGAAAGFLLHRSAPNEQSIRTVINPPENNNLNLTGDAAGPPVLSPDGASIAFVATDSSGRSTLWLRPMNLLEAQKLPDTDGAVFPFWSPDGRSIGFFADSKLKTVELNGGAVTTVCEASLGRGGAWSADGQIIFSPVATAPLFRVSATGGTPTPLTQIDNIQFTSNRWPFFLPDGKHFLYLAMHHDPSKASNNTIYYASLDGHENRPLFRSQSNAVYAAGYILFARGDQLMAQLFDPSKGALSGEPHTLARGVINDLATWHMDASASNSGLLTLGSGGNGVVQLIWMDRATKQTSVVIDNLPDLQLARISPQGDRIALQIDTGINDIWVLDLARGVRTRLTFGPVANVRPVWSPDGRWIAYTSLRGGKYDLIRKPSDGSGAEETLFTYEKQIFATDWAPDGKSLLYSSLTADGFHSEIWSLPLDGERKPRLISPRGSVGQLSPDGRWMAYQSSESGNLEIYVMALAGQGKWQVSPNGGQVPRWSHDGKELFFFDATLNLFAVPVKDTGSALQFGAPQALVNHWTTTGVVIFDVSSDHKKILLENVSQHVSQSITVVTNFTSGLKK
jgi:Tol biopolymer transport system component